MKKKRQKDLMIRPSSTNGLTVFSRFHDLFDDMFHKWDEAWKHWDLDTRVFEDLQPGGRFPKVNVSETKESYEIEIAAAGFSKEDLALELKDNILLIKGDRREESKDCCGCKSYLRREISSRSFRRVIRFPREVDTSKIDCTHEDGIVKCKIGKKDVKEEDMVVIDIN